MLNRKFVNFEKKTASKILPLPNSEHMSPTVHYSRVSPTRVAPRYFVNPIIVFTASAILKNPPTDRRVFFSSICTGIVEHEQKIVQPMFCFAYAQ